MRGPPGIQVHNNFHLFFFQKEEKVKKPVEKMVVFEVAINDEPKDVLEKRQQLLAKRMQVSINLVKTPFLLLF